MKRKYARRLVALCIAVVLAVAFAAAAVVQTLHQIGRASCRERV